MTITSIADIPDMADGQPVMSIEGDVKYAGEVKHGKSNTGKDWSKQFFVLAQNGAEIGCTMWGAEGNALIKGETVNIENTQNKKGQWSGMTKGGYTSKDGEFKHSLEIRANQVKIKTLSGGAEVADAQPIRKETDDSWSSAQPAQTLMENVPAITKNAHGDDRFEKVEGINETRRHLAQSANLYNLCVDAVRTMVETHAAKFWPDGLGGEMFRTAVSSLYIEATRAGMLAKMPVKPIQ